MPPVGDLWNTEIPRQDFFYKYCHIHHTRIPRRQINEKERIEENPHFWCENGVSLANIASIFFQNYKSSPTLDEFWDLRPEPNFHLKSETDNFGRNIVLKF
jgi:hypothetical protein